MILMKVDHENDRDFAIDIEYHYTHFCLAFDW